MAVGSHARKGGRTPILVILAAAVGLYFITGLVVAFALGRFIHATDEAALREHGQNTEQRPRVLDQERPSSARYR